MTLLKTEYLQPVAEGVGLVAEVELEEGSVAEVEEVGNKKILTLQKDKDQILLK